MDDEVSKRKSGPMTAIFVAFMVALVMTMLIVGWATN